MRLTMSGCVVLLVCGGCNQGDGLGEAAVPIPLHELDAAGPEAPSGLSVTRLSGPDNPTLGDSWLLVASAEDARGGGVTYRWSTSSGELSSVTGPRVTWTATEAIGRVEIGVSAEGPSGDTASATLAARVTASEASGPIRDDFDTIGYFCSLAIDGDDRPHLTFRDDTHPSLFYAVWESDAWQVELVEGYGLGVGGDVGYHSSLAVDSAGVPHAAWFSYYGDGDGGEVRRLVYATRDDASGWSLTELATVGHTASFPLTLALNPVTGLPEIFYQAEDRRSARLAICAGDCEDAGDWQHETVYEEGRSDAAFSGFNVAYPGGFVIGGDGARHVTVGYEYRDDDYRAGMVYLSRGGGAWSAPETLSTYGDDSFADIHGARLQIDGLGRPLALNAFGVWQRLAAGDWRMSPYDGGGANHIYRFDLAVDGGASALPGGKVFFTYPNSGALELVETDDRGYFHFSYLGTISTTARARTSVAVDSTGEPHACWAASGDLQYR